MSNEYKRSAFCGFNRELFNNLKNRSIIYPSSSSSNQSFEDDEEDTLLLTQEKLSKNMEFPHPAPENSGFNRELFNNLKNRSILYPSSSSSNQSSEGTIAIGQDTSEDDEEDTLLLTQENLPKNMEFPQPAPENIPSHARFSSKVTDANISGKCEERSLWKDSSKDEEEDTVLLAQESLSKDVLSSHQSEIPHPAPENISTKGSPTLESVECDKQSDVNERSRFSSKAVELNKIFVQSKSFKPTAFVAPLKSNSVKLKNCQKEKASNIFDISDDPYVMEILKQEKAEANNVTGNAKKGSKFAKGVQKITQFSKKSGQRRSKFPYNCDDKEFESPAKRKRSFDKKGTKRKRLIGIPMPDVPSTSLSQETEPSLSQETEPSLSQENSIPMSPSLMISPVLPRKLASFEEDEIEDDVENDSNEYVPDLDELLKRPERPADGSKTKDEILDEFDRQIAERQRLHEEEMARWEADIEAENQRRIQRKMRLKENAKLRNRLETELTETRLRSMFKDNLEYLRDIWSGKEESSRHQAFHKSIRTRHALYYTMITDPFTDDQLDWTLDEIGKVWMSNRRDQLDNKEYVWKVLLPECFIKFYMDFFNVSKNEAMTRISETPLHKKDRLKEFMSKSDEEESEED